MVRASAAAVFRGLLPGAAAAAATPAVLHPESYRHYIDAFNAGEAPQNQPSQLSGLRTILV